MLINGQSFLINPVSTPEGSDTLVYYFTASSAPDLKAVVDAFLLSPPSVNGQPLRLMGIEPLTGGAGNVFAVGLIMTTQRVMSLDTQNLESFCVIANDLATLETFWKTNLDTIASTDRALVDWTTLGGGAGQVFAAFGLTGDSPTLLGDYIPAIQSVEIQLAAGTGFVAVAIESFNQVTVTATDTAAVMGVHYIPTITPGHPGQLDIQAVDETGANVAATNLVTAHIHAAP